MIGTSGDDTLTGGSGDDVIDGGAGADDMFGGAGDDTYFVDNEGDRVIEYEGQGYDHVLSSVSLALRANIERLTLTGSAAINGTGNELDNFITGNGAGNLLNGGAGADDLVGGAGDDIYVVDNGGDRAIEALGEGYDHVLSSVSLTLRANIERLTLTGSAAINGVGNALDNFITGNAAANLLNGGAGADDLVGGAGDDAYIVDNAGDRVIEGTSAGYDQVLSSVSLALRANIERLTLTGSAAINGTGNALDNFITGNAAANVLNGGAGADDLVGGAGDDAYIVDNAGDRVIEGASAGYDQVLSSVSLVLRPNIERLTLTGSAAINGVGNNLDNFITGNAAANLLDGGAGADDLVGGAGDDSYIVDNAGDRVIESVGQGYDQVLSSVSLVLRPNIERLTLTGSAAINGTGNGLDNFITGNSAANVLDGGAGADDLVGGAGDDAYIVDNASDRAIESAGEGYDHVLSSVSLALRLNVERLTLTGSAAINGTGNGLDNFITGNAAANVLDGGAGADDLVGGAGDDSYIVDNAGDRAIESAGEGYDHVLSSVSLALRSNVERLTLTGSAAVNGTGNGLDNFITGNDAANVLDGGAGSDDLVGGGGADRFTFTTALGGGNVDAITDFTVGEDRIALAGGAGDPFAALATGSLASGFFATGTAATDADDRIIYNASTGALLFDADDGTGAAAAVQFATVDAGLSLSAASFVVTGAANNLASITSASTASVAENSPVDTVIYTATAVDPDGDTLTFSLGGTHADQFTIDPVTGVVRLRSPADFEARATYNITVNAVDSSGQGDSQNVTVNVTDVSDSAPPYAVAEQEPNDTLATPQSLDRDLFAVTSNATLPDSSLPSATVTGSISHTTDQDFYTVYLEAGELLVVDIDGTTNSLDALVRVYGPNGVEIAMNDDMGSIDPGSSANPQYNTHSTDSFVSVRVPTSGLYTISVESWEAGSTGSYTMHVSVGPQATPAQINEENIEALISGAEWSGLSLTYGFTTSASQYPSGHEEAGNNFEALNSSQRTAARSTFGMVSALTNLTFTEATASPGSAQLRLAMSDDPETAHAYYPGEGDGGDSWYNNTGGRYDAPTVGNYAYLTFIHEIGHSLGLKHGHESPALSPDRDSMEFSVMTYRGYIGASGDGGYVNETFGYAQSFMMYDIAALQRMYGANFNTNSGDTIYTWSPTTGAFSVNGTAQNAPGANRVFMTLWDGGGNDTYNLANYSTSVTIDLRPGEWTITSTVQLANLGSGNIARGNVANALLYEGNPASLIENAVGGSAADTIVANQVANRLTGGGGADTFRFHSTSDSGPGSLADIITDFVADSDRIDLSGIDANVNLDGNQAFSFIHNQAFSGIAGQIRYQAVGNNLHIFADTNGDSVADMQIVLNNVSEVRAIDFWL